MTTFIIGFKTSSTTPVAGTARSLNDSACRAEKAIQHGSPIATAYHTHKSNEPGGVQSRAHGSRDAENHQSRVRQITSWLSARLMIHMNITNWARYPNTQ